jgi:endonuclease/exonuclease/phosphatase (EEP) superfamily protein YafD
MSVFRVAFTAAGAVLAAACALAAVLSLGGYWSSQLDVLTHFAPLYFAGAIVAAGLAVGGLRKEQGAIVAVAAVAAITSATLIAPEFLRSTGPRAPRGSPGEIKVIQFNAWWGNRHLLQVVDWLEAQKPNVIMVEESSPVLRDLMVGRGWHVAGYATTAMIFTRKPYLDMERPRPRPSGMAMWVNATYAFNDEPVELLVTHSEWPTSPLHATEIVALRNFIAQRPQRRMILAGDFNSTPWSFLRRREDRALGLIRRDQALATWPALISGAVQRPAPLAFLPIDHLYAGPGWATTSVTRGPRLGSDHYPLVVTLAPVGR